MSVPALDYFRLKPEFLPPEFQSMNIYVRPGELSEYTDAAQWDYVGRTIHANRLQAADVERQGYCLRRRPVGFDSSKWYDKKAS